MAQGRRRANPRPMQHERAVDDRDAFAIDDPFVVIEP